MLNKKDVLPGTKVEVISLNAKTAGIPVEGLNSLAAISIWKSPGMILETTARPGDTLTVVKCPRKVRGINLCQVSTQGGEIGEVYWTELRGNCILSG